MKKTYVIDTSILIQAPHSFLCFEENDVVRMLEQYRNRGDLLQGVTLPDGGTLRIEKNYKAVELPEDMPEDKADNRILKVCKGLSQDLGKKSQVILVTKDLVLRIKAQMLGVRAEDFTTEQITVDDRQYTGRTDSYIPEDKVKEFKKHGIPCNEVYQTDAEGNRIQPEFIEHEFVILTPDQSNKRTILGKVQAGKIYPLSYKKSYPYGIKPRNVGQYFMQEALMASADKIQEIFERGIIQTEALNFIRGRSIAKTYLIIDEAQNMTPNQVRGIITRAGKGTKIILLGDPCQIDRPFLDERTNGLSYAAKYMQGSPYCA